MPLRRDSSSAVYVIGVGDNPVKIGHARNPAKRLIDCQIGCPDLLTIHHEVRVPAYLAEPIEKRVHKELEQHWRRGEWFNVTAEQALQAILRVKATYLTEAQAEEARNGDLLHRLESIYPVRQGARDAVCDYREALDAGQMDLVGEANGYVLRDAGPAGYAAFSLIIAQRKPFSKLTSEERLKAEAALVRGINALTDFAEHKRLQRLVRAA